MTRSKIFSRNNILYQLKRNIFITAVVMLTILLSVQVKAQTSRYATVNGFKMYYEIHGTGQPLILLHGGLGSTGMFGANLEALAKNRQVIAMDLQAHGRTADIDRPLTMEGMADDVAALMKHLNISKADLAGYSMVEPLRCKLSSVILKWCVSWLLSPCLLNAPVFTRLYWRSKTKWGRKPLSL